MFDANVLLDVFGQRENAVPAAPALTFAELDAVRGFVCASAFGVICHHGAPRDLVPLLETHLGARCICRVVQVTEEGAFQVEISDPARGWRQTIPLAGFPTREEAERVAGLWQED